MTVSKLEPEPSLRCPSDHLETPRRTHACKLTVMHDGTEHECICGVRWVRRKPVSR